MENSGVVILTGAASGIGRSAAEALAKKSRTLALVDSNANALAETERICRPYSPQTAAFPCDVTDDATVRRTCGRIQAEMGKIGVLVNCAGIARFAPFLEIEPEEWMRMFDVNVMGAVRFMRAVLPGMIAEKGGLIINVGSRMAVDPHATTTAYAASKAALLALTRTLALEVKQHGIKLTLLAPGGAKTNMATPKHEGYLDPQALADAIVYVTENGGNVWVRELTVLPIGF
jgi:NAD(P)-dependent dehydrogenase (short-subunit alcohol dehydrogenase family)